MMKACVICNRGDAEQNTRRFLDDVILSEGDKGTLRDRLELVLEEAIHQEGWVCAQCQTKLKRIERYYSVVSDFRQQYWDTKKQQEVYNEDIGVTRERVQLSDHTYNAGVVLQGGLLDAESSTHSVYEPDHSDYDDDYDDDIQEGAETYRDQCKEPGRGPNLITRERSPAVDDAEPVSHGRDTVNNDSSSSDSKSDGTLRPYMCAACDAGFTQPRNLSYHIREEHTPTLTPTAGGSYMCNFCNKAHSTACQLVRHVRHHTGEKPFKCGVCRKVYTDLGHLKDHMGLHSTHRFPCPVCKQVLGTKHSLQGHMVRMHGRRAKFTPITSLQKQYQQNTSQPDGAEAGEGEGAGDAAGVSDTETVTVYHPDTQTDKEPEELQLNEQGLQVSDVYPVFVEGKGYTCIICKKCFRWPAEYQRHARVHTGVRRHRCQVCGRRYKEASHLKSHMDTHADYIYTCPVCSREHRTHVSLRIHMGKLHPGVPVPRPATFRNKHDTSTQPADEPSTSPKTRKSKRLRKASRGVPASNMFHFKLKQVPPDIPASKPSPGSPGPSVFHFKLVQQEEPEQRPGESEVKEPECTDADNAGEDMAVIADNDSTLDNTSAVDNASTLENISAVDNIPSVDNNLAEDNTLVVITLPDPGTPVDNIAEEAQVSEIQQEAAAADNNNKVNTVRRLLLEKKLHVCKECGKGFRNGIELNRHSLVHTGLRPHQCGTCGKTYKHLSHLNTHMQTHNKIKPTFLCTTCGITVSSKTALNHHMRLHARRPEKPSPPKPVCHVCTECDKKFATKRNLELHNRRRHSGERPYVCDQCNKAFTTQSCLKQHMVTHSDIHPYSCPQCGKPFKYRAQIRYHQRVHCMPTKACDECGKKFYDEASLFNHQRMHADSSSGSVYIPLRQEPGQPVILYQL